MNNAQTLVNKQEELTAQERITVLKQVVKNEFPLVTVKRGVIAVSIGVLVGSAIVGLKFLQTR